MASDEGLECPDAPSADHHTINLTTISRPLNMLPAASRDELLNWDY